jgi:neutral ceramidase
MDGDVMQATLWKAGVAATVITPAEPMWLAGWAARRQPALDKAGDLFCKALALQDNNGNRAVIVTMDLIAVPRELAYAIAAKVQAQWQLPRECLLFNASHTHTGPEVRPDKVPFFEIPEEFAAKIGPYVSGLIEKTADVISAALKNLKPASLSVVQAKAAFAHNRRAAGGPVDNDVPILEVADANGQHMAVLFGYACHNLTLPPTFCHFHGDYAGLAQQYIEQKFPGAMALFLAGAGADQDPAPRGDLDSAIQHARTLAGSIQQALAGSKRAVTGPLRAAFEEVALQFVPLPSTEMLAADKASEDLPRRRKAEYLLNALANQRPLPTSYPCPMQVLRFGNELLLIALGGEPVAGYAERCKTEFAGPAVWVAGYSNDMFGYLPTRRVQAEGGYEGGRALLWSALPAPFTESTEEDVMQTVRRLVQHVRG